ncbi:hypothetical protein SAMN05444164_2472 [Bradyrhizobium erythrophlei]|uniref:Uncharacterized protein n=1 Tax=Bradyrhizobium erythrophlei TaxID=1437360 RepID=A0A1H4UJM6_9BRAD|nr:hypothetical protein SAMN05444164_2472 [Bradyrhizobium erythrophlei]
MRRTGCHRPGKPPISPNYGNRLAEGKYPMVVPSRPISDPSCGCSRGNLAAMFATHMEPWRL